MTRPASAGVAQAQHLALDRAHGDAGGLGHAEPRRVHAAGDDDGARRDERAVLELDAGHAVVLGAQRRRAAAAHVDGLPQRGRPAGAGRSSGRPRRRARAARSGRARARRGAPGSGAAARRAGPASRGTRSADRAPRPRRRRAPRRACRSRAARVSPPSSAQKSSYIAALRRPSSSSSRSPNSASATGASMPAATCQAPGSPSSITVTRRPRRAARQAHARPIGPPPMTATSDESCAGATGGGSLPTPVRPGSGSTVGGPRPPSQPDRGLP